LAALVIMNPRRTFTAARSYVSARQETSIGGTDWGLLQGRITISSTFLRAVLFYVLLQEIKKLCLRGIPSGAVK